MSWTFRQVERTQCCSWALKGQKNTYRKEKTTMFFLPQTEIPAQSPPTSKLHEPRQDVYASLSHDPFLAYPKDCYWSLTKIYIYLLAVPVQCH